MVSRKVSICNAFLFFIIVAAKVGKILTQTVTLTISDGELLGQVNTTITNNITYYNFRGIPYAEPPIGNLRFASPQKNCPWNGTWDATANRNKCVQTDDDTVIGDEDCLYINVYTPDINATNLPVLVWIYGGSFLTGSGDYDEYPPDNFLDQGLVFVSFNYRLGPLGFLSTEDEACPGNWGIKDQILALEWVQENIDYFGGNPENVTIFGQSAGAVSVHLLMQTNLTKGLFQRAIMNSGTTLNLWAFNTRATETAELVGTNLGIITTSHSKLVKKLRKVDAEKLHEVALTTGWTLFYTDALRGLPYAPTLEPDIEGAVYVNRSLEALSEGNFRQVPVLMGFTSEEAIYADVLSWYMLSYFVYYDVNFDLLTPWSLTQDYITRWTVGSTIKYHYFGYNSIAADTEQCVKFISADQFIRPIREAASLMSNYTDVYFYEFGYEGNVSDVYGVRNYSGVGHGEDRYYFFKFNETYSETDIIVSDRVVLLWSNFAKYGSPTPGLDDRLNISWSPLDPRSSNFTYLAINETLELAVNPKQEDWDFYQTIWDKYGDKEEMTTY